MANEKRLIDANALTDTIEGIDWYHVDKMGYLVHGANSAEHTPLYKAESIYNAIKNATTVDAVEVVHGRWEKAEYYGFVRCDQCKDVYIDESWLDDGRWKYCPNCGARMDGERKDNE